MGKDNFECAECGKIIVWIPYMKHRQHAKFGELICFPTEKDALLARNQVGACIQASIPSRYIIESRLQAYIGKYETNYNQLEGGRFEDLSEDKDEFLKELKPINEESARYEYKFLYYRLLLRLC